MGRRSGSPGRARPVDVEREPAHPSASSSGPRRGRRRRLGDAEVAAAALLLVGLFISAVGLRPQLVGVGPLVPDIQSDFGVSHAAVGLLVTVPMLCMGLFAPFAPVLAARLGFRVSIAACLALVAGFGLLRALMPGIAGMIALTLPIGVGMALAGILMPMFVKERFPGRPLFATASYATGLQVGAATAAAIATPVTAALGDWRATLIAFSVFGCLLVPLWLGLARGGRRPPPSVVRRPRLPVRSPVAWALVALFCLDSIVFYGLNAWLPATYEEHGWSGGSAGALVGVMNLTAVPFNLIIGWAADRAGSRRLYLTGSFVVVTIGVLGIIVAPDAGFLWAVILGASLGAAFPLILALPLDVARTPALVGAASAMMLGVGYGVSAGAPTFLGALRDATGSYATSLWFVAGTSVVFIAVAWSLTAQRLHEGIEPGRADAAP